MASLAVDQACTWKGMERVDDPVRRYQSQVVASRSWAIQVSDAGFRHSFEALREGGVEARRLSPGSDKAWCQWLAEVRYLCPGCSGFALGRRQCWPEEKAMSARGKQI